MKKLRRPSAKKKKNNAGDPLATDLSNLMLNAEWRKARFELRPKNKTITLRVSEELLAAVKEEAEKNGVDYQKFIRMALEQLVLKTG